MCREQERFPALTPALSPGRGRIVSQSLMIRHAWLSCGVGECAKARLLQPDDSKLAACTQCLLLPREGENRKPVLDDTAGLVVVWCS